MFFNEKEFCEFTHAEYVEMKVLVNSLKEENDTLKKRLAQRILFVEDGSVDIDRLEDDGFYVIPYRQGAKPPILLQSKDS